LRAAGIEGTVRLQFTVDTAGRADGRTVRTVSSNATEFTAAARDAVVRARYRPAEARGHRVPQLVQQAFVFRLDR
jgi:TonB family protein